ncbi:MAG: Msr family ABC-F type ribosomal protection protein [Oscillospiraceae bacterium]|nr:Msr family ABC-F type ribosomal protection protein [Oscillospiraceae bacterium]MCL2279892.1 Msr family ABC-F type ribosomal protection protein [Oscillospiraceae bacterium]
MQLLVKANDINVEYSGRDVLDIDSLELYSYDRIGLVGGNGAGKSTLLNILSGEFTPAGSKITRLGENAYIKQLDDVEMGKIDDYAMLSKMGLSDISADTMSGGEETRAKIAQAMSSRVHAIFADEPTCHLDRSGIDLLIGQLKAFDGALLIVSHDRYFLDETIDKIWELKGGKITEYWGGYSDYLAQKEEEYQKQSAHYDQIMQEKERLERSAEEKRKQARQVDSKQKGAKAKNSTEFGGRLGQQKSTGTKQKKMHQAAKNIEKRIEALSDVSAPQRIRNVRFRQSEALALHNKFPITAEKINLSFGERVIFENAGFIVSLGEKVAFTGGNGTGKTTLLKMIKNHHPSLTISPKAAIGCFEQTGYKFTAKQPILSFMQEDCDYSVSEIRAVLAAMGFGTQDILKDLTVLSGGEIIKLQLSKLLLGRYNILLLDEPGNYLDIGSMEALEAMMKSYAGTIIFVTHDKRLIGNVADTVYEFKDCKIIKKIK